MKESGDEQIWGEVATPQSIVINPNQQATPPLGSQPMQPIMQQNVMYIQMPKFKHPMRTYSSILIGVGILIYILSIFFAFGNDRHSVSDLGYGACCMMFNAGLVCEIVFYYNMMQHNQSYGQGTGWAITNIVLAAILTVIGLFIALGTFLAMLGL